MNSQVLTYHVHPGMKKQQHGSLSVSCTATASCDVEMEEVNIPGKIGSSRGEEIDICGI